MTGFTLAVDELLLGVLLLSVIGVFKLSLVSSCLSPKTVNLCIKKISLELGIQHIQDLILFKLNQMAKLLS